MLIALTANDFDGSGFRAAQGEGGSADPDRNGVATGEPPPDDPNLLARDKSQCHQAPHPFFPKAVVSTFVQTDFRDDARFSWGHMGDAMNAVFHELGLRRPEEQYKRECFLFAIGNPGRMLELRPVGLSDTGGAA